MRLTYTLLVISLHKINMLVSFAAPLNTRPSVRSSERQRIFLQRRWQSGQSEFWRSHRWRCERTVMINAHQKRAFYRKSHVEDARFDTQNCAFPTRVLHNPKARTKNARFHGKSHAFDVSVCNQTPEQAFMNTLACHIVRVFEERALRAQYLLRARLTRAWRGGDVRARVWNVSRLMWS